VINDRTDWRRPIGVAVVHDGSLVVGENGNPIIWRIHYRGR
jgi:glucose/arabinose dehydrogenase